MCNTDEHALCWDLSSLYSGPDDIRWNKDLEAARGRSKAFRSSFRGRIRSENLSAELLAAALRNYEELQKLGLKPYLYAQLLFASDSRSDQAKSLLAKARETWGNLTEDTLFFELELLAVDEEHWAGFLKDSEVEPYAHYLQKLRAHAPYTLSEEVEQALKRKDLSGKEAFVQLFEELTSSLQFSFPLPGAEEPQNVTGEELLALLFHPDAKLREDAFATFLNVHADNALVLTACFNNLILDHGKEVELRRYPDPMTPTHLANETEADMVERLMEVTESNYRLARDYFQLKRRLLGLTRMKNSDIYAPIGLESRLVPFGEAKETVLAAFHGFSSVLAQTAEAFFTERRIDALPRPGKGGGAFCQGMLPGLRPHILVNFTGTLRDVATLAHELGHGVHFALSQKQNLFHYQAPLPFAETASVFGEMLLTRHLLDRETDRQAKIALLCGKLEDIIATTFRQNVLTRFELAAHRQRAIGLLASDDLCRLWWDENHKLYGDTVEMIEPYRWGWSYISHFVHSRFYCYSYVFGELLVLALFQRYREEGEAFVPRYLELLTNGGSRRPADLLTPFGIDLADPGFWQKGYDFVAGLLQELRELLEEKK